MSTDNYINAGRKPGSCSRNKFSDVYRMMKSEGLLHGANRKLVKEIVNRVGKGVWDKVYQGHIVAIPGLFNMEVKQNKTRWRKRIDWFRTMKLWEQDSEAREDKLLVRAKPTRYFLHVRHSTLGLKRSWWYYSLMLDIKPSIGMVKQIEDRYEL